MRGGNRANNFYKSTASFAKKEEGGSNAQLASGLTGGEKGSF